MSILSPVKRPVLLALLALALALALAVACEDNGGGDQTPTGGETPTDGETPTGGGTTAEIKMVPGTAFDKEELTIAAGVDVEVTVDNTAGTHGFGVYTSQADAEGGADALGETEICSAPCTNTVTLNLAAGDYFFRCEVHTTRMTGTLRAE